MTKVMSKAETTAAEKRLTDAGWWKKEHSYDNGGKYYTWLRDGMNPKNGGYGLNSALDDQNRIETIKKYGGFYYVVNDRYGFGYWIGVYESVDGMPHRTYYDHLSKEVAKSIVSQLNSGKATFGTIPFVQETYESIVKFKEKHGDRYFIVHNRDELAKVALKITLERHEEGYWYNFDSEAPVAPKMTIEQAEKFGMDGVVGVVKREWESYERELKSHKDEQSQKKLLDSIVKYKDADRAITFLEGQRDGEYEAFEVIQSEEF